MHPDSQNWKQVTESAHPHEREALEYVRKGLADSDCVRVWANLEFIDEGGQVHEVDLLVLTRRGFFLVEIKSWQGIVEGDAHVWTRVRPNGTRETLDNPLLLANRKAKKLISLLRSTKALLRERRIPFLEPLVFLSDPALQKRLPPALDGVVLLRDRYEREPGAPDGAPRRLVRPGIGHALCHVTPEEACDPGRPLVDKRLATAITRAMQEIGIRSPTLERRVGDWRLCERIFEAPHCQDWVAEHTTIRGSFRRVRIYSVPPRGADRKLAETVERAAEREFRVLEGINHPSILRALEFRNSDLGPALLFDHLPRAVHLEQYLRDRASELDFDTRLHLVRRIAEALQYAHQKRLVHRALTPRCVLIPEPGGSTATRLPDVVLFNWQTAAREVATATSHAVTMTMHLSDLVDESTRVYVAPEALRAQTRGDGAGAAELPGEEQDLFSLGAIAYHVFSGEPPANSLVELTQKLAGRRGLEIAAVLDGAKESLCELVRNATHPDAAARFGSVREFLDQLETVEEEYTRPDDQFEGDPTTAGKGAKFDHAITVLKRLGHGSTAVAFLVDHAGIQRVLKLAAEPAKNELLRAEGNVLAQLRHSAIVECHRTVEINGHVGLLLSFAGELTLGQLLRRDGPLGIDLLQRYGEDLLDALVHLEQRGISHRDVKPDNIGVVPVGRGDRQHAILFDFSLARTPTENLRAGTGHYIDPFLSLRKPPRWDLHAERFSAAVSLYEMATATLPKFGDGRTDPALLDVEATLDADLLPAALRESLRTFFQQALRRDPKQRFDNAEEMLRRWRKVFDTVDAPALSSSDGGAIDFVAAVAEATLDSPLATLGLTNRALNALERVNVAVVRELLALPVAQISLMRGVGNKTRKELFELLKLLTAKFPRDQRDAAALVPTAPAPASSETPQALDSATLLRQLLPAKRNDRDTTRVVAIEQLLGLAPLRGAANASAVVTQSDVATSTGVTRERIRQLLAKETTRWLKIAPVAQLRDEVAALLDAHGGVATFEELVRSFVESSAERADAGAPRRFEALLRAALETERAVDGAASPQRFALHRLGARPLVAQSSALAEWAQKLGKKADALALADPLAAPAAVIQSLQGIAPPAGSPVVAPSRLVRLAAATSERAAVSNRLELYPKGMPAERALKLAHAALLNQERISEAQLRERIAARYPDAAPLPPRPALDELLKESGRLIRFDPAKNAYVAHDLRTTQLTQAGATSSRHTTAPELAPLAPAELDPEVVNAAEVERRLALSHRRGGFLALSVLPRHYLAARAELRARFALDGLSFDAALLARMKRIAQEKGVDWQLVRATDAAGEGAAGWRNLVTLASLATGELLAELSAADRPLLLTELGLLKRYEQIERLAALRERAGRRPEAGEGPLHGLWLLLAQASPGPRPQIDGRLVPVLASGVWLALDSAWVKNRHRSVGARARGTLQEGTPRP